MPPPTNLNVILSVLVVCHHTGGGVRLVQDGNFVLAVVLEVLTVAQEVAGGHQLGGGTNTLSHLLLCPHQPGVEAPQPGLVVGVVLHVDTELIQLGLQLSLEPVDAVPATLESLHELLRISGKFLSFSREYFHLLLLGLNTAINHSLPAPLSLTLVHVLILFSKSSISSMARVTFSSGSGA